MSCSLRIYKNEKVDFMGEFQNVSILVVDWVIKSSLIFHPQVSQYANNANIVDLQLVKDFENELPGLKK